MIATDDQQRAIFPAYAGVNLLDTFAAFCAWNLPRVCGGEPYRQVVHILVAESSPRMRG